MKTKQTIKWVLLIAGIILLQYLFNELLDIKGIRPDLFLIFLIYLAFHLSPTQTVWVAFFLGMLEDLLFHPMVIGLSPLLKTFTGFILAKLVHQSYIHLRFFSIISSIILIFLNHVIFNWIIFIDMPMRFIEILVNYSLPEVLYTGGIFLLATYFISLSPETE
ncbi:MAG: rod shape-determining protein MreD [Candidatus Marinimicrobia bacterium]|nr:rod shape-determining protein MreD [Candidatus Neomarinimicrobiota bacterium]MDD5582483.1 rod shape-determining protein MreD [Candidatus Neomarinimicrobiota bacterium]